MSSSSLYELTFAMTLAAMVLLSLAAIATTYFILKRWTSVWRKAALAHVLSFAVQLSAASPVIGKIPLSGFLGMINGTIFVVVLALFSVDACRIVMNRKQPFGTGRTGRLAAFGMMLAIFAVGMVLARLTVDGEKGKSELDRYRTRIAAMQRLDQFSPEREMIRGLRENFPDEFKTLMDAYLKQVDRVSSTGRLPQFPRQRVNAFIKSKHGDIARAPDAELIALAQASARNAEATIAVDMDGHCLIDAMGKPRPNDPYAAKSASLEQQRIVGELTIASLSAARAGHNWSVLRKVDAKRVAAIETRLAQATDLTIRMTRPVPNAEQLPCHRYAAYWRAVAGLPAADMAYYMAMVHAVSADSQGLPLP